MFTIILPNKISCSFSNLLRLQRFNHIEIFFTLFTRVSFQVHPQVACSDSLKATLVTFVPFFHQNEFTYCIHLLIERFRQDILTVKPCYIFCEPINPSLKSFFAKFGKRLKNPFFQLVRFSI